MKIKYFKSLFVLVSMFSFGILTSCTVGNTSSSGNTQTDDSTFEKIKVDMPTVNGTYMYTGSEIALNLNGFDEEIMEITGNTGFYPGTYDARITLKDTDKYEWKDDSFNGSIYWFVEDIFDYEYSNNSLIITDYKGDTNATEIIVPQQITRYEVDHEVHYDVEEIAEGALSKCENVERLTLPFVGKSKTAQNASRETLFGYVFGTKDYEGGLETKQYYSSSLFETYYIPKNLTEITVTDGNVLYGSFMNCETLITVNLPNSLSTIDSYAFYNCTSLENVDFPSSLTTIGNSAFMNCSALSFLLFGEQLLYVDDMAFKNCSDLLIVVFSFDSPSLQIGNEAFMNCKNLSYLILSNNTHEIGISAFENCSSLLEIFIPESVYLIDSNAFKNCSSLSIISELSSAPSKWAGNWNPDNRPVEWKNEEQFKDETGMIPSNVTNAEVSIDFFVHIEGQQGRMTDIGNYSNDPNDNTVKYHPEDISSIEMAKFFGAAQAFKKIAPNVKINLIHTSIVNYQDLIQQYKVQNGHLPHLIWNPDNVDDSLRKGYAYDLRRYENTQYYQKYNDYFMSRFNFGGFQAGFPIAAEPWGIFVNIDDLVDAGEITSVLNDSGKPSDSYRAWVDDFTWERLVRTAEKMTTDNHSGMSSMVEYLTSYSVPTIYDKFIREGKVDFTSEEVRPVIKLLLEYENRLAETTVYRYGADPYGTSGYAPARPKAPFAATWSGTENFVRDQYSTFYAENPWAIGTISQKVKYYNANGWQINDHFDFLPYPKLDSDASAYTGIAIEGITVGNQCPIDMNGNSICTKKQQLEIDTAAYFAMFMGLDPRSIEARSKINFVFNGQDYEGDVNFPLSKNGARFSWQSEAFKVEHPDIEDPAEGYDDNFSYQLTKYFETYDLYVTDGKQPDVKTFNNITPGLVKVLDCIYALDGVGADDYVTCLNNWNEPVKIPVYDDYTERTQDIFTNWTGRFRSARDEETGAGALGTDTYVSNVLACLNEWEKDINDNAEFAWDYLQECVDSYYGRGIYDVTDRFTRNNYLGMRP